MADPVHSINSPSLSQNMTGPREKQTKSLEEACRNFESIFVQYMLKEMRQTVPQNGLISGGRAEQMYTSLLDGEMAKAISTQRGMGLSAILYEQFSAGSTTGKKGSE